jgi:hypothetical protein
VCNYCFYPRHTSSITLVHAASRVPFARVRHVRCKEIPGLGSNLVQKLGFEAAEMILSAHELRAHFSHLALTPRLNYCFGLNDTSIAAAI